MYITIATLMRSDDLFRIAEQNLIVSDKTRLSLDEKETNLLRPFGIIGLEIENLKSFPLRASFFTDAVTLSPHAGEIKISPAQFLNCSGIILDRDTEQATIFIRENTALTIYKMSDEQ